MQNLNSSLCRGEFLAWNSSLSCLQEKKCCFIYMLKGTTSSLWAADKQRWWGRKRKGTVHHSGKGEGGREWSKDTSKEVFKYATAEGENAEVFCKHNRQLKVISISKKVREEIAEKNFTPSPEIAIEILEHLTLKPLWKQHEIQSSGGKKKKKPSSVKSVETNWEQDNLCAVQVLLSGGRSKQI